MYVRTIEQGSVVRCYGIKADIDDRKRAEGKLQEDELDLRAIADAIRQLSIVALAPDGTTLYANRVASGAAAKLGFRGRGLNRKSDIWELTCTGNIDPPNWDGLASDERLLPSDCVALPWTKSLRSAERSTFC